MKRLKKLSALLLAAAMVFALASCSSAAEETVEVGIIKMMDHPALNAAEEGFVAALNENGLVDGENLTVDYKDANADSNNYTTIADQFVMDKKDLILAIATPAAQAVAAKTTTIPVLATAVTSFTEAGLVDSDAVPGGNISGTTDMNPIAEQLDLMMTLVPDVKTVGFLYCSSEDNSRLQVEIAKGILDEQGIAYVERTVSNQNEVQQATASIVSECDAIYIPTDNIYSASMPLVEEITVAAGIPVICGENGMVEAGGFASLGLTYYDLGYQAGLMAVEILMNGADISQMPVTGASDFEYYINGRVAEALGIEIPAEFQQYVVTPAA